MKVRLAYRWYDLFVGAYYDRHHRTLYLCVFGLLLILTREPARCLQRRAERTEVELHHAAMWDCPECGRENFCRMVRPEGANQVGDAVETIVDAYDLPEAVARRAIEGGDWLLHPERVTCTWCSLEYPSKHDHEADDDGEEWKEGRPS